jgi:hypothetical protein
MEQPHHPNVRHGHCSHGTRSPEANAWQTMKARCLNPRNPRFADYGGRGITVCDQWRDSFAAFLADMGPRPSPAHTLERIRNGEGYGPGNCRWATQAEQAVNRRTTRLVDTPEGARPLAVVAREHNMPANVLNARLRAGWSLYDAVTTPIRAKQPNGAGRARDLPRQEVDCCGNPALEPKIWHLAFGRGANC